MSHKSTFSSSRTLPHHSPTSTLLKVKPAQRTVGGWGRGRGSDSRKQTTTCFLPFLSCIPSSGPLFPRLVIRLRCNEAADEPDDNYVLEMSSAPPLPPVEKLLLSLSPHDSRRRRRPGNSPDCSPRSLIATPALCGLRAGVTPASLSSFSLSKRLRNGTSTWVYPVRTPRLGDSVIL